MVFHSEESYVFTKLYNCSISEHTFKTGKSEEEKKPAVLVLFKGKSALLDFTSNMLFCCQPFCICYIMGLDNIIGQCPF